MNPIIVVGCGRSGTSLVAGLLHTAGVFMGYSLFYAPKTNPKGHFEDNEFLLIHKKYEVFKKPTEEFKEAIEPLLQERENLKVRWGFKDPRNAYYLDYYLERYPGTHVIWCRRKMEDVFESIAKTGQGVRDVNNNPFTQREEMIEEKIKGHDHLVVNFDDIFSNQDETIKGIMDYCEITITDSKWAELYEFIIPRV